MSCANHVQILNYHLPCADSVRGLRKANQRRHFRIDFGYFQVIFRLFYVPLITDSHWSSKYKRKKIIQHLLHVKKTPQNQKRSCIEYSYSQNNALFDSFCAMYSLYSEKIIFIYMRGSILLFKQIKEMLLFFFLN